MTKNKKPLLTFTSTEADGATIAFEAVQRLGEGGFGCTYLVYRLRQDGRRGETAYAAKFLLPSQADPDNPQAWLNEQGLIREASLLSELDHPQIPKIFGHGVCEVVSRDPKMPSGQQLCVIQEYIDGMTLYDWYKEHGTWNIDQAISALLSLVRVLMYIHSHSVLHRDIKPQNIMISRETGALVLIDFGAAYAQGRNTGKTIVLTPGYTPVEQRQGKATWSSDLYSLGMTVIWMMWGEESFEDALIIAATWQGERRYNLVEAAVDDMFNRLNPQENFFRKILLRMCNPDQTRRFYSLADVEHELLECRAMAPSRISRRYYDSSTPTNSTSGADTVIQNQWIAKAPTFADGRSAPELPDIEDQDVRFRSPNRITASETKAGSAEDNNTFRDVQHDRDVQQELMLVIMAIVGISLLLSLGSRPLIKFLNNPPGSTHRNTAPEKLLPVDAIPR